MIVAWVLLAVLLVVAAAAQRITGIGFALIATPAALLTIGAGSAVAYIATIAGIVTVVALIATRRELRPRAVLPLAVVVVVTMIPTALLARVISPGWAAIVAGALVLVCIAIALISRTGPMRALLGNPVGAGVLTGVSTGLAALAGPMLTAHASIRGWGASLVPNVQLVFVAAYPLILLGHGWPTDIPWGVWVGGIVAVLVGTVAGSLLASRIPISVATIGTQILAVLGGVAAIVQGALQLASG